MPDDLVDDMEKDSADLVGEQTPAPTEKAPEPKPEVEETPKVEAKEEPAPEPKPEKKEVPEWSKALTRHQQELATVKEENKKLHSKLDRLLQLNGIEPEAEPQEQQAQAAALPNEAQLEIANLRQRVQFAEIRQEYPNAKPDKMWDKAWDEAMATYDIDPDADALPEGITAAALTKLADKNFKAQVAELAAKKAKDAPAPNSPPRRIPPKAPGGNGAPRTPASHVPAPTGTLSERDEMLRDCAELVGGAD